MINEVIVPDIKLYLCGILFSSMAPAYRQAGCYYVLLLIHSPGTFLLTLQQRLLTNTSTYFVASFVFPIQRNNRI